MDKDLIKKLLKYAEECDNMSQYKNADILTNYVVKIAQERGQEQSLNQIRDIVGRAGDIAMNRSTIHQEVVRSFNNYLRNKNYSLSTISNPLAEMIKALRSALESALDKAMTGHAGAKGAAEGLELSPGARGSGAGSASGKDEGAKKQQTVNQKMLKSVEIINGLQALMRALNIANTRISDLEYGRRRNLRGGGGGATVTLAP